MVLGHHVKQVRVLNLNLCDSHIDFHDCMKMAAVLSITYQRQEITGGSQGAKRKNILMNFHLSIREQESSPEPLWLCIALARIVFTWLPFATRAGADIVFQSVACH